MVTPFNSIGTEILFAITLPEKNVVTLLVFFGRLVVVSEFVLPRENVVTSLICLGTEVLFCSHLTWKKTCGHIARLLWEDFQ